MTKVHLNVYGLKNYTLLNAVVLGLNYKGNNLKLTLSKKDELILSIVKADGNITKDTASSILASSLRENVEKIYKNFDYYNFNVLADFVIPPFVYTVSYCYSIYALLKGNLVKNVHTAFGDWYFNLFKDSYNFFNEKAYLCIEDHKLSIKFTKQFSKVIKDTKDKVHKLNKSYTNLGKVSSIDERGITNSDYGNILYSYSLESLVSYYPKFRRCMFCVLNFIEDCTKEYKGK